MNIPKSECPACLGDPMFGCCECQPNDLNQSEPVAYLIVQENGVKILAFHSPGIAEFAEKGGWKALYTHADLGEIEKAKKLAETAAGQVVKLLAQLRDANDKLAERAALLRGAAHLAERLKKSSLAMRREYLAELLGYLSDFSASAEPSAPVERVDFIVSGNTVSGECTLTISGSTSVVEPSALAGDGITDDTEAVARELGMSVVGQDALTDLATWKRRAIEAESKLRTFDPQMVELGEKAMQALLSEPKPKELVLTKCRLCDQLQADLTERDQRLDQFQQVMQKVATLRGTLDLHGLREEVEELQLPGLHSRPEERGTPETEPCSGCGAPGWTGACNKCIPY